MATREEVLQAVIAAVEMVQATSGRVVGTMLVNTDLLSDVEGFDSLNVLEVVVQVSETLGVEIPDEAVMPKKGRVPTLTIETVVSSILAHMEGPSDDTET